jgi:hypothetical protein
VAVDIERQAARGCVDSDAADTDVTRSMAQRAGATITEVDGSHVIMVSQPQAVTDVILETVASVGSISKH